MFRAKKNVTTYWGEIMQRTALYWQRCRVEGETQKVVRQEKRGRGNSFQLNMKYNVVFYS